MLEIGDRVIWKPIDHRDHSQDINHIWYGATGTVIEISRFHACIALDDFPNCNGRKQKNRFWANFDELEKVNQT